MTMHTDVLKKREKVVFDPSKYIKDHFKSKFRGLCICCRKRCRPSQEQRKYEKARKKVKQGISIEELIKDHNDLKLIKQILLSKHQRELISYTKFHMAEESNS